MVHPHQWGATVWTCHPSCSHGAVSGECRVLHSQWIKWHQWETFCQQPFKIFRWGFKAAEAYLKSFSMSESGGRFFSKSFPEDKLCQLFSINIILREFFVNFIKATAIFSWNIDNLSHLILTGWKLYLLYSQIFFSKWPQIFSEVC